MRFGGQLAMRLQTARGRLAMRLLQRRTHFWGKVSVHFEVVLDCLAPMIDYFTGFIGTLPSLLRSQQHPSAPSAACFSVLDHDISPLHKSSRSSLHCSSGSSLHCLCMSVVDSFLLINISCPLYIVNDRVFCLPFAETKIRILSSAETLETLETLKKYINNGKNMQRKKSQVKVL